MLSGHFFNGRETFNKDNIFNRSRRSFECAYGYYVNNYYRNLFDKRNVIDLEIPDEILKNSSRWPEIDDYCID